MPDEIGDAKPELGLKSRHVFLDTEVFKRRGHNLTVQPFVALGEHLMDKSLTLHTTDITLRELERQIRADAADLASEATKLSKRLLAWKHKAPHLKVPAEKFPDASAFGNAAWSEFRYTIRLRWHAREQAALGVAPAIVFAKYFDRTPPFHDHGSKEFPDAFVVAALEKWCEENHERMYVVTQDKALLAAAAASTFLIPVSSLEAFLQKVTEAETPEAVEIVNSVLLSPASATAVRETIQDQFDNLALTYTGELYGGELVGAEFDGSAELTEFWIIAQSASEASVLVKAKIGISAEISYEDVSDAIYDKEDGIYFGAENTQTNISDSVTARKRLRRSQGLSCDALSSHDTAIPVRRGLHSSDVYLPGC